MSYVVSLEWPAGIILHRSFDSWANDIQVISYLKERSDINTLFRNINDSLLPYAMIIDYDMVIIFRAFKSETLRHLWDKLPPMNTVALPLDQEEQRSLLSRPDVVQTIASWDYKDGVVVLDRIETVTAVAGHQAIVSPEEYINVDRRSIT